MDSRIGEIRYRVHRNAYNDEVVVSDVKYLLNQLDRQETHNPASLQYLREALNNNRYPHPSDMIAIIDELEASRAAHIKDLKEIDEMLSRTFSCPGVQLTDFYAARGQLIAEFVHRRLEHRRNPGTPTHREILERIYNELGKMTSPGVLSQYACGVEEARRLIRLELNRLRDE